MNKLEIAVQFNSGLTGTLFFNNETAFNRFISDYDKGTSNIIELSRSAYLEFNGFVSTEINRYSVVSIHPKASAKQQGLSDSSNFSSKRL